MATIGATAGQSVPDTEKLQGTRQAHGLATPEGTPGADDARNEADLARRQAESQRANVQQDPPEAESQTGSEGHPKDDNEQSEEDEENDTPPTKNQIEAVDKVMNCRQKAYRKILGVKDTYASVNEERQEVMDAFRELGCLTHKDYNNAENAKKAFGRVMNAAAALGVDDDDIADMKKWDGKSKILDVRLNAAGRWEPKNDDDMDTEEPELDSTQWHQDIYAKATPLLGSLAANPEQADIIKELDYANNMIKERNKQLKLREDQFLINYDFLIEKFKKAGPYLARLSSHPDEEAKRELESINDGLREYNSKHHYPDSWLMIIPEPPNEQTTSGNRSGGSTKPKSQTVRTPKFLTITEREGYVLDRGIEKEIAGYMPAGWGHQLLLREDGKNDLDIYELVRASKFGKKFVERNKDVLNGKNIRLGTPKSLAGKSISTVRIGGVASVRRYPKDEPRDGWERETKTLVFMGLGTSSRFTWYRRSTLGQEFGQEKMDEKINKYRKAAGQKSPLPPTKRATRRKRKNGVAIASDDEDEGSISLGEEDTSDEEEEKEEEEEEEEEDEESEVNEDEDEDQANKKGLSREETKLLEKLLAKAQKKPGRKSLTSSRNSKSKRGKAK